MVSPSATNSAGGFSPVSIALRPVPIAPKTSGTSRPWQAPKGPAGACAASSYRYVRPPEAACAWARCRVGIRNSQSEKISSYRPLGSASGNAFL